VGVCKKIKKSMFVRVGTHFFYSKKDFTHHQEHVCKSRYTFVLLKERLHSPSNDSLILYWHQFLTIVSLCGHARSCVTAKGHPPREYLGNWTFPVEQLARSCFLFRLHENSSKLVRSCPVYCSGEACLCVEIFITGPLFDSRRPKGRVMMLWGRCRCYGHGVSSNLGSKDSKTWCGVDALCLKAYCWGEWKLAR
jgi:hypothetical protein